MDLDIIEIWSLKLAEAAALNDIDLAPSMTVAFIRGGKEKESLFSQKNMLGSFGAVEVAVMFPLILQSIANNAELISKILSPISPMKDSIDLLDRIKNRKDVALSQQKNEVLPEELYVNLKRVIELFTDEMLKSGLSREQCDSIACNIFLKLLENPSSSIQFVKTISKVPEK